MQVLQDYQQIQTVPLTIFLLIFETRMNMFFNSKMRDAHTHEVPNDVHYTASIAGNLQQYS